MHRARPCTHTTIVSESSGRARNTRRTADSRRGVALTLGDEGQQLLVFRLHDAHQLLSQRLRARARVARVPLDVMILTLRVGGYARSRATRARMVGQFCGRASACVWGLRGSVCKRRFHGDGRGLSPPSRPFRGHILVFHTGPPTHFPCFYFTRVSASGRMDLSSRTMPLG